MNTYRLTSFDESIWLSHERAMTVDEFRSLLLEHLEPLAETELALREEGLAKFGGGSVFFDVQDGKVVRYDGSVVDSADPVAFEEWQQRFIAATFGSVAKATASAGFTKLEPTASIYCSDDSPMKMVEDIERGRAQ